MQEVDAEHPHLRLHGLAGLEFEVPLVVLEGEDTVLLRRELDVLNLVDEEDAVRHGYLLAEVVGLLVEVDDVGAVGNHLEVLLLEHFDHRVRPFLQEALEHHGHVEELSLLAPEAGRSGLVLQLLLEIDRASKGIEISGQLDLLDLAASRGSCAAPIRLDIGRLVILRLLALLWFLWWRFLLLDYVYIDGA